MDDQVKIIDPKKNNVIDGRRVNILYPTNYT